MFKESSETLTGPNEIVEYDNTYKIAQNKYHEVFIILHADLIHYGLNEGQRGEKTCGHTAIQHRCSMAIKSSSSDRSRC